MIKEYREITGMKMTKEKHILKKMYKVLALQFHPYRKDGNEEVMKRVNKVKEEWGIWRYG